MITEMTLILRNLQNIVKFNVKQFERDVRLIRRLMGVATFDIGILCVDNDEIAEKNVMYRQVKGPTDVLAFPFLEGLIAGEPLPDMEDPEDRNLGDIYLGLPYIQEHSERHGEQLHETLVVMFTHGTCHLMGYDHETGAQWKQMRDKEMQILDKLNKTTGYTCKPLLGIGH